MIDTLAAGVVTESVQREVERLIYSTSLRLDAKDFRGWLDACAADFRYIIRAFSHEIRKDMVWLEHDYNGVALLVRQLPRHNTDQSIFTRHTTVYTVTPAAASDAIDAVSAVAIYRTTLEGETKLFAIGRYYDTLVRGESGWQFRARELRLETRNLGIGTHYPL